MTQTAFSYSGTELDALAEVENYYAWLIRHFKPHVGTRTVEVGAGIGTFSAFLLNSTNAAELILIEPADNNFPVLCYRFGNVPRTRVIHGYREQTGPGLEADSVVAVNVLEHVPDDAAFLKAAHATLNPSGKLLLFVPAMPQIFGTLDEAFDHFRRYTKATLRTRLEVAGFRRVHFRYLNLPGVLSWFLAGRVLRRRTLGSRDVRLYDRYLIPLISRIESRWEPPFGQSLIAIASK